MNEDQKKVFQERLTRLMKERGMSAGSLAVRMNLSNSKTIRNYMTGKSFPCASYLRDIAQIFCVTTDYLLCSEGEKNGEHHGSDE